MLGVLVNCGGIVAGTLIGLLFKKLMTEKIADMLMKAVALVVLYIGITGILEGEKTMVTILSMVCGALIGTLLDIDRGMNRLGDFLQKKLVKSDKPSTFAEGFVSASLLFCVGAMAIVGSLSAGLANDNDILFSKAAIDTVSALIFSATLGAGVALSAVAVFLYQGAIVLLATCVAPFLSDETVVAEMTCAGSLIIIALALNMLGLTKIKVANLLPAVFLPLLFCLFL